jgi:hypothetical protein
MEYPIGAIAKAGEIRFDGGVFSLGDIEQSLT